MKNLDALAMKGHPRESGGPVAALQTIGELLLPRDQSTQDYLSETAPAPISDSIF